MNIGSPDNSSDHNSSDSLQQQVNTVGAMQQQLLTDIFHYNAESEFEHKGLAIYQRNLRASALRALTVSFPTVTALIGDDLMKMVSELLLQASPPDQGDWSQWGENLADLLASINALEDFPFVPDCARLDWIIHQSYRAADSQVDLASLTLLSSHRVEKLAIQLSPSLQLFHSKFPVADIRQAHQYDDEMRAKILNSVAEKIRGGETEWTVIYRQGHRIEVSKLSFAEYQWFKLLQQHSLETALALMENVEFSFEHWLTRAVSQGWLERVKLLD